MRRVGDRDQVCPDLNSLVIRAIYKTTITDWDKITKLAQEILLKPVWFLMQREGVATFINFGMSDLEYAELDEKMTKNPKESGKIVSKMYTESLKKKREGFPFELEIRLKQRLPDGLLINVECFPTIYYLMTMRLKKHFSEQSIQETRIECSRLIENVKSILGGQEVLTPKRKLPNLLEIEFNEFFYDGLKNEINSTYFSGSFTSTMLLGRKLLENLVIEILRIRYPPNKQGNLEMYYNARDGKFHDFTILLKNLEERKDDFGIDKEIITEFISLVKPFRPRANANAHSMVIVSDEDEVLKWNIPKMAALLLKLWNNLKQSNK